MPVHDWTRVEAGIFHHFHHRWITAITDQLNDGLLPSEYYALAEQQAAGFGPDILTLQAVRPEDGGPSPNGGAPATTQTRPRTTYMAESKREFYRRKKSAIVVRHVSDDDMVAVLEVVSPGNKAGRHPFKALIEKACELLEAKIHLLILDLFPPTDRDPKGIHGAIWNEVEEEDFTPPPGKPLLQAAYEAGPKIRAFVEGVAVGDRLPDMPLFLRHGTHINMPLEATYQAAFAAVPLRWRRVLDPKAE